jgi:hypothetical protein
MRCLLYREMLYREMLYREMLYTLGAVVCWWRVLSLLRTAVSTNRHLHPMHTGQHCDVVAKGSPGVVVILCHIIKLVRCSYLAMKSNYALH